MKKIEYRDGDEMARMFVLVKENQVKDGLLVVDHEYPDGWYHMGDTDRYGFPMEEDVVPVRLEMFGHAFRVSEQTAEFWENEAKYVEVGAAPPDAKPIILMPKK